MTYLVPAAEHVKYENFTIDMMIHRDTLLQFIVYLNFSYAFAFFCDDFQMTWIIVKI